MANEEFQPASIAKVSKACTSICQWVRAMNTYHFVAKGVEPKRVRVQTYIMSDHLDNCRKRQNQLNSVTLSQVGHVTKL